MHASQSSASQQADDAFSLDSVPAYSGEPYVEVHGNVPFFTDEDRARTTFESYSKRDLLGRCGVAFALVSPATMPSGERGSIGDIRPSGWRTARYGWIDGEYLFNRCHLIAFALAGENDNARNLITGTRSLNVLGMLPFEEQTARYIDRTRNHVLYRVTPVFEGKNLVASGVLMEAESIEDAGKGVRFCVWCYNVEPGVVIDYASGKSVAGNPITETYASAKGKGAGEAAAGAAATTTRTNRMPSDAGASNSEFDTTGEGSADSETAIAQTYILNTNTHRFHYPDCKSVSDMKEKNKQEVEANRDDLINQGYRPCGNCRP